MTSVRLDEPYRLSLERNATKLAAEFSNGELGATECVRGLLPVLEELGHDREEPLNLLVGFNSELDGLPVGSVRELWAKDALEREDQKRHKYEERIRNDVLECCQTILTMFDSDAV